MDRASFTGLMCRVWEHVTPVSHGLNRPEQMAEGMGLLCRRPGPHSDPRPVRIPLRPHQAPAL